MNVGIYLYEQAEVLDFAGPFEVFSTANRLCPEDSPFEVFVIAETTHTIRARGGFQVTPHYAIDQHPALDVLVVVGGVHSEQLTQENVINWLRDQGEKVPCVASVCTGAFLLAQAQLLL